MCQPAPARVGNLKHPETGSVTGSRPRPRSPCAPCLRCRVSVTTPIPEVATVLFCCLPHPSIVADYNYILILLLLIMTGIADGTHQSRSEQAWPTTSRIGLEDPLLGSAPTSPGLRTRWSRGLRKVWPGLVPMQCVFGGQNRYKLHIECMVTVCL